MYIYEEVPVMENGGFILRLIQKNDCDDLLNVYSDERGHKLLANGL